MERIESGIINILKPAGITSNAVLTKVKKVLNIKKVGHLGTLDPLGTGVLPVCVGKATRLFDYYLNKDKVYRTIFVFGKTTDTLDSEGKIINENDRIVTKEELLKILPEFIGMQNQMPPIYSAKKVNGKKAYDLARENIEVVLKPKAVEIYDIKIIDELYINTFLLEVHCSSGTYIRSLVRDFAAKLNTFGYMGAIIRTKSGDYLIENAVKIQDITEKSIIPIKKILENTEKVVLKFDLYDKIVNGIEVEANTCDKHNVTIECNNKIIGIGDVINGKVKLKTFLLDA